MQNRVNYSWISTYVKCGSKVKLNFGEEKVIGNYLQENECGPKFKQTDLLDHICGSLKESVACGQPGYKELVRVQHIHWRH